MDLFARILNLTSKYELFHFTPFLFSSCFFILDNRPVYLTFNRYCHQSNSDFRHDFPKTITPKMILFEHTRYVIFICCIFFRLFLP